MTARELAAKATARPTYPMIGPDTPYQRDDQDWRLGPPPWKPDDPALVAWEAAHGHDVRLDCHVEYGCLLIDRDLEQAERDLAEALALLNELMLPTAWQPITDHPGMSATILSDAHMERVRAFLARREAPDGK